MPKHWSKIVTHKDHGASESNIAKIDATIEEFNELVKNSESFRNLLDERDKLENNLKQHVGKNNNDQLIDIRYQNEIPAFSRKKKEELQWRQKKIKAFQILKNNKSSFEKWNAKQERVKEKNIKGKVKTDTLKEKATGLKEKVTDLKDRSKKMNDFPNRFSGIKNKKKELSDLFERQHVKKVEHLNKIKKTADPINEFKSRKKDIDELFKNAKRDEIKNRFDVLKVKKSLIFNTDNFDRIKSKQKTDLPRDLVDSIIKKPVDKYYENGLRIFSEEYRRKLREKSKEAFFLKKKLEDKYDEKTIRVKEKFKDLDGIDMNIERRIEEKVNDMFGEPIEKESLSKRKRNVDEYDNLNETQTENKPESNKKEKIREKREELIKERRLQERREQKRVERKKEKKKDKFNY